MLPAPMAEQGQVTRGVTGGPLIRRSSPGPLPAHQVPAPPLPGPSSITDTYCRTLPSRATVFDPKRPAGIWKADVQLPVEARDPRRAATPSRPRRSRTGV